MRAIFFDTMFFLFAVICFLAVVFSVFGCVEHIGYKDTNTWSSGEITIVIDESVDSIGNPKTVHTIIEESFLAWNDEIDTEINLNFVYGSCNAKTQNCVRRGYVDESSLASFGISFESGYMQSGEIIVSEIYEHKVEEIERGFDLRRTMLHEAGHWWGLRHSDTKGDVMFNSAGISEPGNKAELSANDIGAIRALYN